MVDTYSRLTFQGELTQVEEQLQAVLGDLQTPFRQLVEERMTQCWPPARAAVVLATGVTTEDTALLCSQRIHLGTALELLYVALGIHTQLLGIDLARNQQGRSRLGSTILAGDYCFSRAADMAVRTQSPVVVEIFAQALKRVSEGHLRHLFQPERERFDENADLLQAGVVAAGTLIGLGPTAQSAAVELAALCTDILARPLATSPVLAPETLLTALQPFQQVRWRELLAWLQPR
jgi:octaprenyl-diphosphate synthase